MAKAFSFAAKIARGAVMVVGAGSLLLGGYVLMSSLPDVKRYIRISTM
jgi:hypothetical protein